MRKKIFIIMTFFGVSLLGNEISSFTAIKYKADFEKQEHQAKQTIINEYAQIKKIAKTLETTSMKGDSDLEVSKNLMIIDIWSKKFLQSYNPTDEELIELYKTQKPTMLAKYELRNILVSYEKNADMIIAKLNLIKNPKDKKESFIKYVKSVSNDTNSKNNNGLTAIVDENRLHPQIKEALLGKAEGEIVKVNMQDLGTQILFIEKIIPQKQASFEESKEALINLAKRNALNKNIELLSK